MKIIFFIMLTLCSMSAFATELRDISNSRTWQKLLHMSGSGSDEHNHAVDSKNLRSSLYDSEIETTAFFLSQSEHDFAHDELLLTLAAIKEDQIEANGFSFRCNYPARTYFLAEKGLVKAFELQECPELLKWIGSEEFDISIVYADGYLGNPASFYGHLILKFDHENGAKSLLDNSLNFGASVPDNENPVIYILKGLTGGYDAKFSSNYFYRHNLNYREVELRDLWQYQLELSKRDEILLATHAFEVMRTNYTYYFTHRNCAYHLAKILEVISDQDLIDNQHPFVLPISVFKRLTEIQIAQQEAIRKILYHPSRQTRFREKFATLSVTEKSLLQEWVGVNRKLNVDMLDPRRQVAVLNTAYDYIEYVLTQLDKESAEYASMRNKKTQLQRALIAYPPQYAEQKIRTTEDKVLPHSGHRPSLLRATIGREAEQDFLELQLRPAFYDELSLGGGKSPNSSVSMGDLRLRYQDGDLSLSSLSLLTIETFPLGGSGLPNDTDLAWKLRLGVEQNFIDGVDNSNEWFVESAVGWTFGNSPNFVSYAMIEGRAQTPNKLAERFFVMPKVGFVTTLSAHSKLACYLGYAASTDIGAQRHRRKLYCATSLLQDENLDIRLSYDAYFEKSVKLGFSWYW
ncbi:DUF4105 domain-containing protein [Brumicola nitratireducens]|nr:DUF4105 domain-containing protein [Glaciecola nitratireducens]